MAIFDEALKYYELGWSVLPIRRADKKPALNSWREYQTARPERYDLEQWFAASSDLLNVGVIAGKISNLAIVDFDGYSGNDPTAFLRSHNLPTNAPIAITGKGFHVYYKHPGGTVRNGVRLGALSGVAIDLRGDGGYVVAPPSVHESGREYHWFDRTPFEFVDENYAWDVLPDAFTQTIERDQAQTPLKASDVLQSDSEIARLMRGVGEGERNQAAAKLAGFWLKVTHGDEQASLLALRAWNSLNTPSLGERELLQTFKSIASRHVTDAATVQSSATVMDARAWASAVRDIPPRHGVPCPTIPTLSEVGGIVERDLLILAGRPGMGKSTAAWGTVVDVGIRQHVPTIIFSTEMTAADVARWCASKLHKTPVKDLTPTQWNDALKRIAESPLTMCDQGSLTVHGIVETVKARPETKLVIVDHIQRIVSAGGETRNLELGRICKTLKSLAKDHGCTVLVLSQLSRAQETQQRRPQLSDLRESGDLEQEADAVIFLWSDHDDPTADPLPVEFYLAKNRHGAISQVSALFHKSLKNFVTQDFQAKLEAMQQEMRNKQQLTELMEAGA